MKYAEYLESQEKAKIDSEPKPVVRRSYKQMLADEEEENE